MSARRYRIRLYDRGHEVLDDRKYAAVLDLRGGTAEARAELDRLVRSLARADGARGDDLADYHLRVEEWDGQHVMDWPGKTGDED